MTLLPDLRLGVNLLEPAEAPKSLTRRLNGAMAIVAALLVIVTATAVGIAVQRQEDALVRLETDIGSARKEALAARKRLQDADIAFERIGRLRLRRAQDFRVVAVWEEVTRRLPNTAWLTDMRIENNNLWLDGYARSASELVRIVAQSSMFSGVALSAPVTRDAAKAGERFQLRMKNPRNLSPLKRLIGARVTDRMATLQSRSPASRVLALTLLAALIGLIWLGVIDPVRARYHENDEALANGAQLPARLRSTIVEGRRASAGDDVSHLDRYRSDFLAGAEDAIVVADLQTRLSALTTARRAEVASARALQPKSGDGLVYVGLRCSQFAARCRACSRCFTPSRP